jgi:hypothetical protein
MLYLGLRLATTTVTFGLFWYFGLASHNTFGHRVAICLAWSVYGSFGFYWSRSSEEGTPLRAYEDASEIIWSVCLSIMLVGFLMSAGKVLGDQNWFARSGGIVTFISGYWELVADRHRHNARQYIVDNPSIDNIIQQSQKSFEFADTYELRRIRKFGLFLLGVGTLVWALGDLVQFLP